MEDGDNPTLSELVGELAAIVPSPDVRESREWSTVRQAVSMYQQVHCLPISHHALL